MFRFHLPFTKINWFHGEKKLTKPLAIIVRIPIFFTTRPILVKFQLRAPKTFDIVNDLIIFKFCIFGPIIGVATHAAQLQFSVETHGYNNSSFD